MAHLKNLVVNGNSRTIGTAYASDYVGKVNGYTINTDTKNTVDTWVPVISYGTVQHREIPADYNNPPSTLSVNHAVSAKLIDGLKAGASSTWGNKTGSNVVSWDTASGGSIQVRDNNPGAGQCSILVDGTVYVNEGRNAVISTADIGNQSVKYATSAGSANSVAWGNVTGKPATYTPSSHTHTVSQITDMYCDTATTDTKWSACGIANPGTVVKALRSEATAPSWALDRFSSGIAFGGSDTKAVLFVRYDAPAARVAGGNGTQPVWSADVALLVGGSDLPSSYTGGDVWKNP